MGCRSSKPLTEEKRLAKFIKELKKKTVDGYRMVFTKEGEYTKCQLTKNASPPGKPPSAWWILDENIMLSKNESVATLKDWLNHQPNFVYEDENNRQFTITI